MFVHVKAGKRSMCALTEQECLIEHKENGEIWLTGKYISDDDVDRKAHASLNRTELKRIILSYLTHDPSYVDDLCENELVLDSFIKYAIRNNHKVGLIIGNKRKHEIDNLGREMESLKQRNAELEAMIKKAKEALGVPHLTSHTLRRYDLTKPEEQP